MLAMLRRLWEHLAWADDRLLTALEAASCPPPAALLEYAHILGADEVWLARLERRQATAAVWPDLELPQLRTLARSLHTAYARYLAVLDDADLPRQVSYTNSAGQSFHTPVQEVLVHVALHAQYHRGKINLLLRQAGLTPMPTDYIGFIRGVPAATTPVSGRAPGAG
jgi:uncharacterized damage-inducible protein DinB